MGFLILLVVIIVIVPDNCEALPRHQTHKSLKTQGKKETIKITKKPVKTSSTESLNKPAKPNKLKQVTKRAGTKIGISLGARVKPYIKKFVGNLVDKCKNITTHIL